MAESSLALAGYVTAYMTKAKKSNLQDVWTDIASNGDIYSILWSFGNRAMKSREVGLYEAADLLLGNHLTEKSATIQFVNARLPSKRSRMLKKFSDLKCLNENDPNSEDVFMPTLIEDHCPARPKRLGHMCLYDFVRHIDWCHQDKKTYRRVSKPSHPVYDPVKPEQTDDHCYSLILLFVPFWDENDLYFPLRHLSRLFTGSRMSHHDKLNKMLKATSTKKKFEARKELDANKKL